MLKTVLRVLFGLGLCTIISGCMIYSSLGLPWETQNLDGSTSITWRSASCPDCNHSIYFILDVSSPHRAKSPSRPDLVRWGCNFDSPIKFFPSLGSQKVPMAPSAHLAVKRRNSSASVGHTGAFVSGLSPDTSPTPERRQTDELRASVHLEWTLRKLSYVRRGGRESTFTHRYASLVETVHSHSSRGPFRCRSGQP